ncbi:glycosyltransferase family 2 protein [Weissella paramesenteroides]|uniref:glycosyltransferase family 2 protein n=1 Tax=Weissella paramesenteroides TaxID=1249 RepID=UPI003F240B5E
MKEIKRIYKETKISVISPVYNAANYIERFLKAIKSQTFQNFQWILIDDGSNDETLDILKKFRDRNQMLNILVLTKLNGGVSSARNLGLKYVTGDYLTFADSDDVPQANWLENINNECLRYGEIGLFVTNARKVKPDLKMIKDVYSSFKTKEQGTFEELASGLLSLQVNGYLFTIVAKSIYWEKIKFDEHIQFLEDELAFLEILLKNPEANFVYKNFSNYFYVQNPNSYLHTMTYDKRLNSLLAVEKMESILIQQGVLKVYEKELNRRKASVYFSLSKLAVVENEHDKFEDNLSKYRYYEKRAVKSKFLSQRLFDFTKYIVSFTQSEFLFRLLAMRNDQIQENDSLKKGKI